MLGLVLACNVMLTAIEHMQRSLSVIVKTNITKNKIFGFLVLLLSIVIEYLALILKFFVIFG